MPSNGYLAWRTLKSVKKAADAVAAAPNWAERGIWVLERLFRPLEVVYSEDQPAAYSVEEVDVHPGGGDPVSHPGQRPRPVFRVDNEHVTLVAYVEARVLHDLADRARVVHEKVHHGCPLDVVARESLDVDACAPNRLRDVGKRARAIGYDDGQVLQQRASPVGGREPTDRSEVGGRRSEVGGGV